PSDFDEQLGLLLGLAPRALGRRLAQLQEAARIAPPPERWLDPPPRQVDAAAGDRKRADHDPRIAPRDVAVRTDQARTVVVLELLLVHRLATCRAEARLAAEAERVLG